MLDFRFTEFSEVRIPPVHGKRSCPAIARYAQRRGTVPHAAKMPMSATSPEVVEQMHHCMPKAS
jgi:hypothetical protein